eukprot:EG_transcript_4083
MAMAAVAGGATAAPHQLAALPYDKTALQPQISPETLEYHHGRHHQAYVTRLNELLRAEENAAWRGKSVEELVLGTQGALFNQAAQIWNHDFYWRCLRANPSGAPNPPTGAVKDLIDRDFGSFEQLQAQFTAACVGHFGSGWVWLVYGADQRLAIVQGHDASNPLRDGRGIPILTCDVWEHAYYIDHRNARPAYVARWWQLVNWDFVNDTLGVRQMAMASTVGTKAVATSPRVEALRKLMVEKGLTAYLIPSSDPHMSEYTPLRYRKRDYISGFDGSYGFVVVTLDKALLWTDGRYFLQAEQQLQTPQWQLMKMREPGVPTSEEWVADHVPQGGVVGYDPWTLSPAAYELFEKAIAKKGKAVTLQPTENLVDTVWAGDAADPLPPLPSNEAFVHELQYAGKTVVEKLADLAKELKEQGIDKALVTALDDVAWLMNLRGSDVDFNPVFMAYCIASADGTATLFVDAAKLPPAVRAHLAEARVAVQPYDAVEPVLASDTGVTYTYDLALCNMKLHQMLKDNKGVQCNPQLSLVSIAKSVKNSVELEGMQRAHLRDAVAMVKFFVWLEKEVAAGRPVTECSAADQLERLRAQGARFVSLSFPTISGADSNGAVIHYRPLPGQDLPITRDTMYLLDSGAQYLDGTTDITRTVHLGEPSPKQRECFTRVLQGHLGLRNVVFPDTTTGVQLDAYARMALWRAGLDYNHGTGHGVGCFLNVHEGPHNIAPRPNANKLRLGSIVSNEPGYYEDGAFGVRIENLIYVT